MRPVTVLFIHGTGVRLADFQSTLKILRARLPIPEWHGLKIEGCNWGDLLGSRTPSLSVPDFLETGGKKITDEEAKLQTWRLLAADPVCELRLLSLNKSTYQPRSPKEPSPESLIMSGLQKVESQTPDELQLLLERAEIAAEFSKACAVIRKDGAYLRLLDVAENPVGRYLDALANALVAEAILLAEEQGSRQPLVDADEDLRDELTLQVRKTLGLKEAGRWDSIVKTLGGIGSSAVGAAAYTASFMAATPYLKLRRGRVSESASPIAGDILLYQSREGAKICELIRSRIIDCTSPVVLLAHSLGGVACVDLLIDQDLRDRVPLLVTIGSQAPYFYEINALRSLPYSKKTELPHHFPPWLNLYNRRDFLSYVGGKIFPGRVVDCPVTSSQPFPQSHSAYWTRPATYEFIREAIKTNVQ